MSYVPNYRKVNHSFHLLMSAVTLGVWAMTVWPCAILFTWWTNRGKRKRSDVQFSESLRLPAPPPREEFVHGVPYPVRHAPLPVIPALPQRSTVTPHDRAPRIRPYVEPPAVTPQPPTPTSAPAPVQPVITPRVVTPVRPVAHVKVRHTKTREDCP